MFQNALGLVQSQATERQKNLNRFTPAVMLQGILLVASLLVAFTPVASTAFGATWRSHSASTASKGTSQTFSPLAALNACPPTQADGASGTWVKVIQFRLNNLGAYPLLATDGGFGAKTKAAVISFQKQQERSSQSTVHK